MKVTIELAVEDNLYEIMPMVTAFHEFEALELSEDARERSVATLLGNSSAGGIWLVYADKKLAGYIALCTGYSIEFAGIDAFIDEFYILPEFRGQGVGEKVLELIKQAARRMNIKAIHLEVARSNHKAQKLYTRAKFRAREKYVIMSVDL